MSNYTTIDGQTVHKAVAAAFYRMAADFKRRFGETLHVSSGKRSYAEGVKLFTTRYRVQWTGRGPFGDVKWWQGKRYVRYSSNGTVAVPGTSLHESDRAIDIRDSGADPGVTRAGEPESNWIKANAHRYGFNPRGFSFGEPWHIEFPGALTVPAGFDVIPISTEPPKTKENNMDMIHYTEKVVDVPGIAGVRHATWKDQNTYLVFTPSWYKEIVGSGAEANSWARIVGHSSRKVEKGDVTRAKKQIDSLTEPASAAVELTDAHLAKLASLVAAEVDIPTKGTISLS